MEVSLSGLKLSTISSVVPEQIVPMSAHYQTFGENEVKRICQSTGIKSVHVAPKTMKTSDMCVIAAERIFATGHVKRDEVDGLVFVSQTPDYRMPATSCILQDRLGLENSCVTLDINYGCSGYIYGLYQAALLVSSGSCRKVLVCVGDTMTHHLAPTDQKTQLILGDGAAVSLVEQGADNWSFSLRTDGAGHRALIIDKDELGLDQYLVMDGSAVMEFALREVPSVINRVRELAGWEKPEVDQYILHQANQFMLNYLRKVMKLEPSKVPISVEKYGNTGPASIPITLCDQFSGMTDQKLEKVILSGFGVGLSWGAVSLSLVNCVYLSNTL